ncbi:MAG: discoidin domain-containing protein [Kiritimatiellaeota bacterium]|nr:discoidin domain-containing protein [Kiritimatiellota bacterium]
MALCQLINSTSLVVAFIVVCTIIVVFLVADNLMAVEGSTSAVETQAASALGTTGLTVNGRINPHTLPTRYYFEYGLTANYGFKTVPHQLPPRLTAYYYENWDYGLSGWQGGMNGKDLVHHVEESASKGFVRFLEPSGNDPNHVDGIGTLHLCSYFFPATCPSPSGFQVFLGGSDPDLRGARVKIKVRGNKWVPNGAECVWWTQSDNDISRQMATNWQRANWAYTGFSLNDYLGSGKWEKVEYRLNNNSHDWTYGGNNLAQNRPDRYAYASLNDSLGRVSCDFFHLLAYVNPHKFPEGSIDFDEFELAYRNYSLLLPSNGGKLLSFPAGSPDAPAALTDGWRNGPDHMWHSALNPADPLEFTYTFANPVTIQTVQIHQHPEWPSKEVEVLVSDDGQSWKPLLKKSLPENSPAGPNFAFLLERGLSVAARYVRVRILSGYKPQYWGLGEIEMFGTGAIMQTDDDWYHVNLDIADLKPGQVYHFRLVAANAAGTSKGADQTFTLPADNRPYIVTGPATRIRNGAAKVEGRLNPLGQKTQFYFEYGLDTNYGQKTDPQYGGRQITPRTSFVTLSGLKPGAVYHYRLVGVNATGTGYGSDAVFTAQ